MSNQTANITWRDEIVPVSTQFDDPYFSLENGLAETRFVFLEGNQLAARMHDGFHIAELGFGTGLNLLATWALWDQLGQNGAFQFTTFEAFPMDVADMEQSHRAYPELAPYAEKLRAAYAQSPTLATLEGVQAQVILGDARETLPAWDGMADAWFLDGFSPAKNPELWSDDLMMAVGAHTKSGGSAATYTAAGFVRRALEAAGFEVSRTPGFGRKRHMTQAQKP